MFLTDCHTCGLRELRGTRSVELLANTGHGIELVYRCTRCATSNVLGASSGTATAGSAVAVAAA